MLKKVNQKTKIIISIISIIVGIGLLTGSYSIGCVIGANSTYSHSESNGNDNITGVYTRQYSKTTHNGYSTDMIRYAIFKENGACIFSSVETTEADSIDYNETSPYCSYTYDFETKSGVITITTQPNTLNCNFFYKNSILTVGVATYSKLQ